MSDLALGSERKLRFGHTLALARRCLAQKQPRLLPALCLIAEAVIPDNRLQWWASSWPLHEMSDPLVEFCVGLEANGIEETLFLQVTVDLRICECGITAKEALNSPSPIREWGLSSRD